MGDVACADALPLASESVGAIVLQHLAARGLLDRGLRIRTLCLPDRLIDHATQKQQYDEAGLGVADIVAAAIGALGHGGAIVPARA